MSSANVAGSPSMRSRSTHSLFAHDHHSRPDAARIAALSAAMALNLAVLLIAARPMGAPAANMSTPVVPVQVLRWITPPAVIAPPPMLTVKPLQHPVKTVPHSHLRPTTLVAPAVASVPEGHVATVPTTATPVAVSAPAAPSNAPPVEASLAYRSAPLQFPVQAMRQQMHGTVLLRVLVDETGKPLEVQVERGSGYALLDRSAREQVLAAWRFQPAVIDGRAVRAWARVPVSFDLRQQ